MISKGIIFRLTWRFPIFHTWGIDCLKLEPEALNKKSVQSKAFSCIHVKNSAAAKRVWTNDLEDCIVAYSFMIDSQKMSISKFLVAFLQSVVCFTNYEQQEENYNASPNWIKSYKLITFCVRCSSLKCCKHYYSTYSRVSNNRTASIKRT